MTQQPSTTQFNNIGRKLMKILATTLILSSLFFGTPVIAGSGHDHGHSHAQAPATKETAESNAGKAVAALVVQKKLDESWASVTVSSSEKKLIKGDTEWLVIYINEKIIDTEKQKLYVFLTLSGEYIAANFTGK
ncbi:MAG: hypothetical protein KAT90_14280 [Gammaproteobacteria bacterium]|nr:hypothetical protein [Gammaproteobacteria bacterium]